MLGWGWYCIYSLSIIKGFGYGRDLIRMVWLMQDPKYFRDVSSSRCYLGEVEVVKEMGRWIVGECIDIIYIIDVSSHGDRYKLSHGTCMCVVRDTHAKYLRIPMHVTFLLISCTCGRRGSLLGKVTRYMQTYVPVL